LNDPKVDENNFDQYTEMNEVDDFQDLYIDNTNNKATPSRNGADNEVLLPSSPTSVAFDVNDPLLFTPVATYRPPLQPPVILMEDDYSLDHTSISGGSQTDPFGETSQGSINRATSFEPPTLSEYMYNPLAKSATFDPLEREHYYSHRHNSTTPQDQQQALDLTANEDAYDPPATTNPISDGGEHDDLEPHVHEDPPTDSTRSFPIYGRGMIANSSSSSSSSSSSGSASSQDEEGSFTLDPILDLDADEVANIDLATSGELNVDLLADSAKSDDDGEG
jgi:hypothetical protein